MVSRGAADDDEDDDDDDDDDDVAASVHRCSVGSANEPRATLASRKETRSTCELLGFGKNLKTHEMHVSKMDAI